MGSVPAKGLEVWAVEWEDAHFSSLEYERDEIVHRPTLYITVGILVKNDETGVTLSSDIGETGSFRGTNFVPRKMILRTWKVGPLAKRATRLQKPSLTRAPEGSHP